VRDRHTRPRGHGKRPAHRRERLENWKAEADAESSEETAPGRMEWWIFHEGWTFALGRPGIGLNTRKRDQLRAATGVPSPRRFWKGALSTIP
jgi:hypothetical protein